MQHRLIRQLCYVMAALWALQTAASAAGIATVLDVVNDGYRTPPGADEITAKAADELVQDEALRTERESEIKVRFTDGSELSVEQSSEVVLSDYLFDGAAASGIIDLNDGLFHFTSNGNPDQDLKLRTPVATIGIRGTEFLVHVDEDGVTVIDILDGAVDAVPHGRGKAVTCIGGQSILVSDEDVDAQCGEIGAFSTAAAPPSDPSHGRDGGQAGQDRDRADRKDPPAKDRPDPEHPGCTAC